MPETLIILIIIFLGFVQGIYWLLIFNRLQLNSRQKAQLVYPSVSLIICTRNALDHLRNNLSAFLVQDYPAEFELILVDDASEDGTGEWIQTLLPKFPQLQYYKLIKSGSGKKQALALGISKASHSWIALSDADCRPVSAFWLKTMLTNDDPNAKIVLGYAPYFGRKGWLNKLIRFETCLNAIQSFNAVQWGIPYTGTGRNLVYHKSIFDYQALRPEYIFGDDDFLISAKSNSQNTRICTDSDSFVYSESSLSYKKYFQQKWRHYGSSLKYTPAVKLYLIMYFISFIGFYSGLLYLIVRKQYIPALSWYIVLTSISWLFYYKYAKRLKENDLCRYYPVLNWIYIMHLLLQFPFLWIKKKNW